MSDEIEARERSLASVKRARQKEIKNLSKVEGQKSRAFEIDKKIIPIKEIINLIKND